MVLGAKMRLPKCPASFGHSLAQARVKHISIQDGAPMPSTPPKLTDRLGDLAKDSPHDHELHKGEVRSKRAKARKKPAGQAQKTGTVAKRAK
eukprot:9203567-Alexandrium_andersonii.AAC.1